MRSLRRGCSVRPRRRGVSTAPAQAGFSTARGGFAGSCGTYGTMGGMRKTTVYLPERLKAQLARAAAAAGRSEADLIREGIELVAGRVNGAEPRLPLFASGDPDLAERVDEHLVG